MIFRLLSWNIMHPDFAGMDKYPYCDAKNLEWSNRHPKILQHLQEYKADIICLQEVDASTIDTDFIQPLQHLGYSCIWQATKQRLRALAKWQLSGAVADKPNTIVCAIFFNSRFMEVAGTRNIGSRLVTVILQDSCSMKNITLTNVHLDAYKTPEASAARCGHMEKLKAEECHIVVGDFNDSPGTPSLCILEGKGFLSGYSVSGIPDATFRTDTRREVIDHMYVKGLKIVSTDWVVLDSQEIIPSVDIPSDHIPIMYTLSE